MSQTHSYDFSKQLSKQIINNERVLISVSKITKIVKLD